MGSHAALTRFFPLWRLVYSLSACAVIAAILIRNNASQAVVVAGARREDEHTEVDDASLVKSLNAISRRMEQHMGRVEQYIQDNEQFKKRTEQHMGRVEQYIQDNEQFKKRTEQHMGRVEQYIQDNEQFKTRMEQYVADQYSVVVTPKETTMFRELGRERVWLVEGNTLAGRSTTGSGFFINLGQFGVIFLTAAHVLCPTLDAAVCSNMTGDQLAFIIKRQLDNIQMLCFIRTEYAHRWVVLDMWPARCASTNGTFQPTPLQTDVNRVDPGHAIVSMGIAEDADASGFQLHLPTSKAHALQVRTGVVLASAGLLMRTIGGAACRLDANATGNIIQGAMYSTLDLQDGMSGGPVFTKQANVIALNHGQCASSSSSAPIALLVKECATLAGAQKLTWLVPKLVNITAVTQTQARGVSVYYDNVEEQSLSCA